MYNKSKLQSKHTRRKIACVAMLSMLTLLPRGVAFADEPSTKQASEIDNPADGDIGDTPGYNIEKTRSENSLKDAASTADGNELIDVTGRTYPKETDIVNTVDYYNLGNIESVGTYANVCFEVKEDDVTRIQVIYQGTSPEVVFYDSAKKCYPGQNKTYEDGFCVVKKTQTGYSTINSTKYNMDIYYIEYPQLAGQWIAQISTMGVKEFILSQTTLPTNWQSLGAEKEVAAEIDGPTYFSMENTGNLTNLTQVSDGFIVEQDEIKIKAEEEDSSVDYSSIILVGVGIGLFALVFIAFKVHSNKKMKEEELRTKKEKEMAEFKAARKKTKEQIAKELTEKFANEDWSDVPQKQWNTKPTIVEVAEEEKDFNTIHKRVSQLKENNAEYANTLFKDDDKVKAKEDAPKHEKIKDVDVILNPIIPDIDSGNDDDDGFFF